MSKLKELISELCPDGVEYKTLGEVAEVRSGWGFPNKYQGQTDGVYPFYKVRDMTLSGNERFMHHSENYVSQEIAELLRCKPAPSGSIIFPKIGAAIATEKRRVLTVNSCYDNNVMALIPSEKLADGYLWLVFSGISLMSFVTGEGAVPSIRKGAAVPPIEVQREVVRILDSFQELDDALTAEIEAREKQFDTCLSKLMHDVSEDAAMVKLGSQMTIVRGASPRPIKSYLTTGSDGVHWIKIGDVAVGGKYVMDTAEYVTPDGAAKSRFLKSGSLILSNSMSFGRPYILGIDGCIHDGWLAMSGYETSYDRDFLYYLLRSDGVQTAWEMAASTSTVRNLNADIVRDTLVPLPNMDKQLEIVRALDELMRLTDLLRSERDARRKQFEHYRDKLLSFPEKGA